jgi:hypothetical protein
VTVSVRARRPGLSPLPSGGDLIFLVVIFLLTVVSPNFVLSDGSTGWHLVTGQYIIDHLRIPHRDLISYTFPARPWIPYEWLFDVVAALLVNVGGLTLLALATAAAIAGLFLALYHDIRRSGCHYLIALILTTIGALTSSVHWLARPHLFTFFGVYIFSRTLEAFHRDSISARRTIVTLGLTMIVWTNAHPGFLIGFPIILIYLVSEAATAMFAGPEAARRAERRARWLALGGVVTAVATLGNLNGPALYPYLANFFGQTTALHLMAEFLSPTFHGELYSRCLELLFAALAVGLTTSRRKPWLGQFLLALAFAYLALAYVRALPLFAIVSLPIIAPLLAASNLGNVTDRGARAAKWLAPLVRLWERTGQTFDAIEFECRMHLGPAAVVAVLAASCIGAGRVPGLHPLVSARFDPAEKPTTTLNYISSVHLPWNRGFSVDNWGGYIRYTTGQRVFIDDRLDFYGQDFYLRYLQTINAQPGWEDLLREHHIDWVLVNKTSFLAIRLRQLPDWQLKAKDQAAYLFVRKPSSHQDVGALRPRVRAAAYERHAGIADGTAVGPR